ncbi:ABC transporter ATP-binding protein [Agromyces sp. Marseille-Q5079]|uniref:ABC transporter ATP-binding protein n=1 Tax=Agromyces sp. Marseille-Q5079 TaxID=3439059 RepID=UPI003D9C8A17
MTARLAAHGLCRRFGPTHAVEDVGLVVDPGQVHALVGLNGAGKTTLMRLLLGMLRPDHGGISIGGVALGGLPAERWARVGHLIETPFAYPELSVRANLTMAAQLRLVDRHQIPATVDQAISELELGAYAHVLSRRLSQGNRQRLGLAAALQHHPELIVLDEPSSSLDPAGVILLREAILRRRDAGAGILVSSHHLDEVARIADRITVMNHGRLIGTLDPRTPDLERAFFHAVHADDEGRR